MATSPATMEFLLDVLCDSRQVSARRMFGEYCLYYAGRPIGLVCDEQLFLKPSAAGRSLMREPDEGAPFPGARPHLRIAADAWDDRSWMNALVRATFDSLPPPPLPKAAKAAKPVDPGKRRSASGSARAATLAALPNLGPQSQTMLHSAGIQTVAQLRKLGAVAAYAQVKRLHAKASLNLLWALEGALCDLPWQEVARAHRTSLLLALEQHQAEHSAQARGTAQPKPPSQPKPKPKPQGKLPDGNQMA